MKQTFTLSVSALALAVGLAGPAAATDASVFITSWSAGYKEADVRMRDVSVSDRGTLAVQQSDAGVVLRADTRDNYAIEIDTYSLGYHDLDVDLRGVDVEGAGALVIHQGSASVISN